MRPQTRTLARQVSIFPVLMVVDEDDSGQITIRPLPVDLQWQLGLKWLMLLLLGWLGNLWPWLAAIPGRAVKSLARRLGSLRRWPVTAPLPALTARVTQHRWGVRVSLEIGIALILGHHLGLAAVGR